MIFPLLPCVTTPTHVAFKAVVRGTRNNTLLCLLCIDFVQISFVLHLPLLQYHMIPNMLCPFVSVKPNDVS